MLYRRFTILTALIAVLAIVFINIVQATTALNSDFAVGDRLKQWEQLEKRRICPRAVETCDNGLSVTNSV